MDIGQNNINNYNLRPNNQGTRPLEKNLAKNSNEQNIQDENKVAIANQNEQGVGKYFAKEGDWVDNGRGGQFALIGNKEYAFQLGTVVHHKDGSTTTVIKEQTENTNDKKPHGKSLTPQFSNRANEALSYLNCIAAKKVFH